MNENLSCGNTIEVPLYSTFFGKKDTCCFCGGDDGIVDQLLRKEGYKTVLPLCAECKTTGHEPIKERQIKK